MKFCMSTKLLYFEITPHIKKHIIKESNKRASISFSISLSKPPLSHPAQAGRMSTCLVGVVGLDVHRVVDGEGSGIQPVGIGQDQGVLHLRQEADQLLDLWPQGCRHVVCKHKRRES